MTKSRYPLVAFFLAVLASGAVGSPWRAATPRTVTPSEAARELVAAIGAAKGRAPAVYVEVRDTSGERMNDGRRTPLGTTLREAIEGEILRAGWVVSRMVADPGMPVGAPPRESFDPRKPYPDVVIDGDVTDDPKAPGEVRFSWAIHRNSPAAPYPSVAASAVSTAAKGPAPKPAAEPPALIASGVFLLRR